MGHKSKLRSAKLDRKKKRYLSKFGVDKLYKLKK